MQSNVFLNLTSQECSADLLPFIKKDLEERLDDGGWWREDGGWFMVEGGWWMVERDVGGCMVDGGG